MAKENRNPETPWYQNYGYHLMRLMELEPMRLRVSTSSRQNIVKTIPILLLHGVL